MENLNDEDRELMKMVEKDKADDVAETKSRESGESGQAGGRARRTIREKILGMLVSHGGEAFPGSFTRVHKEKTGD